MKTEILLISPTLVNEHTDKPIEGMNGAEEKSNQFSKFYKIVAEKQSCYFLDIADYIKPSKKDGCHFDRKTHSIIASVLEKNIISILKRRNKEYVSSYSLILEHKTMIHASLFKLFFLRLLNNKKKRTPTHKIRKPIINMAVLLM